MTQFPWDEALYEKLVSENDEELETFKKEEGEAEEIAGDTEIQAAKGKKAEFWARVGDKVSSGKSLEGGYGTDYVLVSRRKPCPPTKQFLKKPAFSAPKSTSYSPSSVLVFSSTIKCLSKNRLTVQRLLWRAEAIGTAATD